MSNHADCSAAPKPRGEDPAKTRGATLASPSAAGVVPKPESEDGQASSAAKERLLRTNPRGYDAARRDLAVFERMVRATGTPRYSERIGLVRRQVNRMLSCAQPNPVNRLLIAIEAADPEAGREVIEYICQELGGRFVPDDGAPQ